MTVSEQILNIGEELIGKIRHYLRQKTDKSISTDPELKVLKEEIKELNSNVESEVILVKDNPIIMDHKDNTNNTNTRRIITNNGDTFTALL